MLKFVQIALALHYTHSKVRAALVTCSHHAQQRFSASATCTTICLGQAVLAMADQGAACNTAAQAHAPTLYVSSTPCIGHVCHLRDKARACFLQGIIHRDLKANNIFCCSHGIVKLGDFGISKALGQQQNFARTMVGTPYYMSPEILKARSHICQQCRPCASLQRPGLFLLSAMAGMTIIAASCAD